MVQQLPNGWRCAARALRLAVACAILAWAVPAPAQEYRSGREVSHVEGGSEFAPPGYVPDGETPDWMATYQEYCQDECGDCECGGDCADVDPFCIAGEYAAGERWWFNAEYLLWKTDSTILPPLATDSAIGTAPVVGGPTTKVIAGGIPIANHWRSGYKLELGIWFDDCNELAIVGDYFNIGKDDYDFYFPGDTGRNTGRPFFNTVTGSQFVRPISGTYPDPTNPMVNPPIVRDGTIQINADDEFQGTGITIERTIYAVGDISGYGPGTQVVLLGGYRFYGYDSRLAIADSTFVYSGAGAGTFDSRRDVFTSDNEFNGGEIGARVRFTQYACWWDGMFKIALGAHRRNVTVDGSTYAVSPNGQIQVSEGGLLTSSLTNIGEYSDTRARLIPVFRLGFGVNLTPNWVVRGGYTAIVWSGVARASGALPPDLEVDPRNIPGGSGGGGVSPYFPGIGGSELVANGLDLGFEFNY
jgi:hypothetical protein